MEATDTAELKTGWRANWVTEGIILGAISVSAYFLAFSYETGWCEAFDIPHELITVTPLQIFRGALTYLLIVLGYSARYGRDLLELLFPLPDDRHVESKGAPREAATSRRARSRSGVIATIGRLIVGIYRLPIVIRDRLLGTTLGASLLLAMLLVTTVYFKTPGLALGQRSILLALAALPPLAMHRLERQLDSYPVTRSKTLPLRLTVLTLAVGVWMYVLHFIWGYDTARGQTDFHILPGKPEKVVLAIYGSHLICAPLDRAGKHWRPPLTIQSLGDSTAVELQREQVGPLTRAAAAKVPAKAGPTPNPTQPAGNGGSPP